ncbi:flagellar filament capping protein FliD [Microbacterium oxydans]|uniref:flagellar filament capping protein FliD n=1 Tax=Microbacterium sp. B19(2022) TaxID=2914045 RepID=UPI001430FD45|nr:flagellar filament capping protein FliD [Microbacterium sp. B19(2022)]NJI60581.1 flagellar filament capping protein FliD [Microbacterium sp. B19(2022)]
MSLSLDGLVSGLKTTEVIKALMDVHAIPRSLLKAKMDDKNGIVTQLQTLNTAIQNLATAAGKAASPDGLARFTTSSSSNTVTVATRTGAAPVSAEIVVDKVAKTHTIVSAASNGWPVDPPVITLENAKGERLQIEADGASMQEVAQAINEAGFGVVASAVPAGRDADGNPLHRLQLRAADSGEGGQFRAYRGDLAAVEAGTASDIATEAGAAVIAVGADAQLRLWAGTSAEQVLTSSSNTFTDLFDGVDVTVSAASADAVMIGVTVDTEARTKASAEFIAAVKDILTRIDNGSKATVAANPGDKTTLGVFTGDSTVRSLRTAIADAIQHPVDGVSPSSIGIETDMYGVLSFDEEKFAEALAKDPDAVAGLFSDVASRVQDTAKVYSDKYDGLLTSRITGQESEVKSLGEQMERWDVRLAQRKATLERTYARLEVMLSQLQSQSTYLSSQIAALPTSSSGK